MFREFIGFCIGVYVAQNYHIPDLLIILEEARDMLTKYQKFPPEK